MADVCLVMPRDNKEPVWNVRKLNYKYTIQVVSVTFNPNLLSLARATAEREGVLQDGYPELCPIFVEKRCGCETGNKDCDSIVVPSPVVMNPT